MERSRRSDWGLEIMVLPLNKIALAVQAAKAVKRVLPDSFYEEMKKYVDTTVQSAIEKMNLVTQDKFEEQNKLLIQLREKIEALEESATKPQQQTKNKT